MSQPVTAKTASAQSALKSNRRLTRPLSKLVRLLLLGAAMQIIYIIYIVAFPLISNTRAGGPAADLEILMRSFRWFAPIYTTGILLLFYLFWQAIKTVAQIRQQAAPALQPTRYGPRPTDAVTGQTFHRLKLFVLIFGLLFGFTLIWLYPITANDLFRYIVRGRIWAVYHQSPLITPPEAFPNDPYLPFAGEYADLASGYGPLWELVVQLPLRLGATDMVPATVGLKLLILLAYLLCAIFIGWGAIPESGTSLTALTFFAWNPLILMQFPGNGHNDIIFLLFVVLGIILWQRQNWWGTALVLTLAALAKAPGAMMLPLFGIVFLRDEATWRQRIYKTALMGAVSLATIYLVYATFGPVTETIDGLQRTLSPARRGGFSVAATTRVVIREIIPRHIAEPIPRTTARYLFILFYLWLLLQLWRNKLTLITAGFLAYFSQIILWRTFRIWYPTWIIPLAALHLTPAIFWRTLLFGLTAELSIINYFVVWRWWLRNWSWGRTGSLSLYWNYWTIMYSLTVPWLVGIPLLGPIIIKRWMQRRLKA